MSHRIFFGISTSWIRLVAVALIQLVQTPVLFKSLDQAELGVWYLFFTVATFISLSDLGLPSAYNRAVSYIWGKRASRNTAQQADGDTVVFYERIPISDLYRSARFAMFLLGATVACLGFPLAYAYLAHSITLPALQSRAGEALAVFLMGVVLNTVSAIPYASLNGLGDMGWDHISTIAVQIIGFILVLWLVPLYKDIRALSYIYCLQGALLFAFGHILLRRRHRAHFTAPARLHLSAIRRMYHESAPVFVTRVGGWLVLEMNLMIAGYFLGSAAVPDYAVLRQLLMLGLAVSNAIPMATVPYAAAAHAGGDASHFRYLYLKAVRYALTVAGLWTAGFIAWTPDVMDVWIGKGHFLGYAVLIPMIISSFLEQQSSAHCFFVWSAGRWPFMIPSVLSGVLNVFFASAGCRLYGFQGLVWGTLLAQLATNWYGVYYPLKHLAVPFKQYLRDILNPIMLFIFLLAGCGWSIKLLLHATASGGNLGASLPFPAVIITAGGILCTAALGAVAAWKITLTPDNRKELLGLLGKHR